MKKVLAVMLSVMLIVSAVPFFAAASDSSVNLALYRVGSTTQPRDDEFAVAHATDGDSETEFVNSEAYGLYWLDLGKEHYVDKVVMSVSDASYSRNVNIYLANNNVFNHTVPESRKMILKGDLNGWGATQNTIELSKPVLARYIIVEKPEKADTHDSLRISELEVYGVEAADLTTDKIGNTNVYRAASPPEWATDADANSQFICTAEPGLYWLDLGAQYYVDMVKMKAPNANFTRNVNIYLSNTNVYSNTVPASKTTVVAADINGWGRDEKAFDLAEPVLARYVIVEKPKHAPEINGVGDSLRISDLQVYGTEAGDLTTGKVGNTNVLREATPPANATDADANSQFICLGEPGLYWLDLGAQYYVDMVKMKALAASYTRNVNIYLSNTNVLSNTVPESKTTVVAASTAGWGTDEKAFELSEPVLARYIIVEKTQKAEDSDSLRISDLQVYGVEAEDLTTGKVGKTNVERAETPAANATDADANSQFVCTAEPGFYWLDLGGYYNIDMVKMKAPAASYTRNTSIYLSNEDVVNNIVPAIKTPVVVADETGWGTDEKAFDLAEPVLARYIVIEKPEQAEAISGVGDSFRICDLQVYGKEQKLVNIATNKPSFAASLYPVSGTTYFRAMYGNDGNASTSYTSSGSGELKYQWVMDLEDKYNIEAIALETRNISTHWNNYEIWLTNDIYFTDANMQCVYKQGGSGGSGGKHFHTVPAMLKEIELDGYRYVVVQAPKTAELSVVEIEVFVGDEEAVASSADNATYKISTNRNAFVSVDSETYPSSRITNGKTNEVYVAAAEADSAYAFVDLGAPQYIDYITYAYQNGAHNRNQMKFVATNDSDFADTTNDVILYQDTEDGTPFGDGSMDSMAVMEVPDAYKNTKFRYVGFRVEKSDVNNKANIGANFFDVYTKGGRIDEAFKSIDFTQTTEGGTEFTLSGKEFLSLTGTGYTFVAAAYDEQNRLVEVRTYEASVSRQGIEEALSGTIDFSDSENLSSIKTVTTFLWDGFTFCRPISEKSAVFNVVQQ